MAEFQTPQDYLDQAIVPAAIALGICTLPHLQIGFGTGAHETGFKNERQIGGGPALGPFQMEPATFNSLQKNFIAFRPKIKAALQEILGEQPCVAETMMQDVVFAAAMMFVKYLDCPGAIPTDLNDQAAYYVRWYCAGGKATVQEYLDDWKRLSEGVVFPAETTEG